MGRSAYLPGSDPSGGLTPLFRRRPQERIAASTCTSHACVMPRKLRGPTEGLYHVAARAAEGETLFRDEHDFLRFETELERVLSPAYTCVGACGNPVEAGLCDEPADWLWSSYRAALGLPGRFAFADPSMILACFDSVEQMRAFVETPWESDRTAGSDPLRGLTPKSTAGSDPRRGSDPVTEGARPPAARQSSRRA